MGTLLDKHSNPGLKKKKLGALKSAVGKPCEETTEAEDPESCAEYHEGIFSVLEQTDREIYDLITQEFERLRNTIQLVAAENFCSRAVLAALGSVFQNKTAEGFPGARLHGGCEVIDELEQVAIARAKQAFGAKYANVQPHSGTSANLIVLTALLERGDKILSMGLDQGGHFSHGSKASFTGKFFNVENYYVDKDSFFLDYDAIREQARKFLPKLIICGASVYSRTIDFRKFREIADEAGAYLLADISHISGLVIAGVHSSPVNYAHFTTTSTYKLGGPRGGLILMGKDYDRRVKLSGTEAPLYEHIDKATFPGAQGTPYLNHIAAKAVFFKEALSNDYKARQFRIVENAKALAENLVRIGYDVLTGGTDNHMILMNVGKIRKGLTGRASQKALQECGIVVDMIRLPYDKKDPMANSGIRLGTPIVTKNGMGKQEMNDISGLMDAVLRAMQIVSEAEYRIDKPLADGVKDKVRELCRKFPMR
jgi:glycine hydroxymethyltransferase